MNIPALLAANVLIVGAGIMTYDVMRADPPTAPLSADGEAVDLSRIEERLDDLERRLDGVDTSQPNRQVTSRLLQLENRLAAMETTPAVTAELAPTEAQAAGAMSATDDAASDTLAAADMEKIKAAVKQLETDRERERSSRGVDRMVDRLGLQLTDEQKQRLGDEFAAFRTKMRDQFRNGGMAGQSREDVMAAMETMREDFGKSLTEFLPQADADSIVEGMASGMGGGRRGPPGGGGGGLR